MGFDRIMLYYIEIAILYEISLNIRVLNSNRCYCMGIYSILRY